MIVEYRTPWSRQTGWAIAARGYARAMQLAGLHVHLTSWMQSEQPEVFKFRSPDPSVLSEVSDMLLPPGRDPDISVLSSTLGAGTTLAFENWPKQPGQSVLYTTFEREQLAPELVDQLNRLDGVWVPCRWNKMTCIACGVRPNIVEVFPHVYFDDDPLLKLEAPEAKRAFLWIGQWEPRKAPHRLIKAFLNAFDWRDEAHLFLKTNGHWSIGDYESPETVIDREAFAAGWRREEAFSAISVIRNALPREDIVQLYEAANVYVSASRGEGFDLPCFQAKLAGRRVVTTDSGGPRDFLDEHDVVVPATDRVAIDPAYNYGENALHFDHDLDALIAAMRSAADMDPPPRADMSRFRAFTVGECLRSWFLELSG